MAAWLSTNIQMVLVLGFASIHSLACEPWGVGGVVESFQVGCGWGKVGNGIVDPPKLGVFTVGSIPVLLLDINLNSRTELWWECC